MKGSYDWKEHELGADSDVFCVRPLLPGGDIASGVVERVRAGGWSGGLSAAASVARVCVGGGEGKVRSIPATVFRRFQFYSELPLTLRWVFNVWVVLMEHDDTHAQNPHDIEAPIIMVLLELFKKKFMSNGITVDCA
ncbi:hypothetical protein JTE90_020936 [Oedothorax gibbosus]|uniref:Uncharacterized protein n=1 Tax=Oedothorax gibbosus TaxID=931172 RepID=A0AAV6VPX3_9ARAC|nr:hypothetical protein JTE90_020936 [Oedothorax gibbosus]